MNPTNVVLIGSGGTWGRGSSLDAAWEQIMGCLCWRGEDRPVKVPAPKDGRAWAARRTKALREAVACSVRALETGLVGGAA
jgi:hypothetical protein